MNLCLTRDLVSLTSKMKKLARKNSIVPVTSKQPGDVISEHTTEASDKQARTEIKGDKSKKPSRRLGSYAKILSRSFSLLALHPITDGLEMTKLRRNKTHTHNTIAAN